MAHVFGSAKVAPTFRGLVVSSPLEVDGRKLKLRSLTLDSQELRMQLLFWDQLLWPSNSGVGWPPGDDAEYLMQCGILSRPRYGVNGDVAEGVAFIQRRAFLDAEHQAPGCWALWTGINAVLVANQPERPDARGLLTTLHSAIPVPDQAVPLNELLDFKRENRVNLLALRIVVEGLYEVIVASVDRDLSLRRALERSDAGCVEAVKAARSSGFPLRLSSLKTSFKIPVGSALIGALVGQQFALPGVGAVIGAISAIGSCVSIGWDVLVPVAGDRQTPYRYVADFHRELFR